MTSIDLDSFLTVSSDSRKITESFLVKLSFRQIEFYQNDKKHFSSQKSLTFRRFHCWVLYRFSTNLIFFSKEIKFIFASLTNIFHFHFDWNSGENGSMMRKKNKECHLTLKTLGVLLRESFFRTHSGHEQDDFPEREIDMSISSL